MKFYQVRVICKKNIFSRKEVHDSSRIFKEFKDAQNYGFRYQYGLLRDGIISDLKEVKRIEYVELYLND